MHNVNERTVKCVTGNLLWESGQTIFYGSCCFLFFLVFIIIIIIFVVIMMVLCVYEKKLSTHLFCSIYVRPNEYVGGSVGRSSWFVNVVGFTVILFLSVDVKRPLTSNVRTAVDKKKTVLVQFFLNRWKKAVNKEAESEEEKNKCKKR